MCTIKTSSGNIDLVPATTEQLRGVDNYWPMGLFKRPDAQGHYGLVFQCGDQEVWGIKAQLAEVSEEDAGAVHHLQRILVATALPYYLEKRHRGVMVPCPYIKDKSEGKVECGITFFVGPDVASKPGPGKNANKVWWDEALGAGASLMIYDMLEALSRGREKWDLPLMKYIGFDLRPRLHIVNIVMHFAIHGSQVIAIITPLDEREPIWKYVVGSGLSSLPYAPMLPWRLPEC